MTRVNAGFTLLEVLATLLLLAIGVAAVVGLLLMGMRINEKVRNAATGMATALTVLADPAPLGRTADAADADKDEWGSTDATIAGRTFASYAGNTRTSYDFTVSGTVNGYYVRRHEVSTAGDVVDRRARWVTVTVDVYQGRSGLLAASLKRRVLRSW